MTVEIRPYRPEERVAFDRQGSIVFGNYDGDQPRTEEQGDFNIPPEWSVCAFEDGVLATTYAAYPLVVRLNGSKAPMAGVTMVGTLPWFRRRGHLRKIMEYDFKRRYEQRLEPIAGLLASMAAIYQRYGYGVCSTTVRYTVDPKYINFAPSVPRPTGTWREASKDELPLLQQLYREFSAGRNGYLHRAPVIWDLQVLATTPSPGDTLRFGPSLISVYEEAGEPKGYVTYNARYMESNDFDRAGAGQRLLVRDMVWNTFGAYRAAWELFKTFDLVNRVWIPSAPPDDPGMHVMLDPRELNATARDHLLCRVLDIERALPLRPYGHDGRIVFEVRDEMCPWNADRWALETGPEGSRVTRVKESPELTFDVSTLAQLLFGQISATQAVRYGRAEAAPDAPLERWDAIWRTAYAPFCPDGF